MGTDSGGLNDTPVFRRSRRGASIEPTLLLVSVCAAFLLAGCVQTSDRLSRKRDEPILRTMPAGDAAEDAAGRGQLFESIVVEGYTDIQAANRGGTVLADVNRDGWTDILTVYGDRQLRLFLNRGCFEFKEHPIAIRDSKFTATDLGRGANIPNLADFNNDGFLDIFISRSGRRGLGNSFLVSQGAFDVFVDHAEKMGVQNVGAYCRQSCIADVNGDGWLDIAVGADNIGEAWGGYPIQRLYLYEPADERFEGGHFIDIGGTAIVPDFGGPFRQDPSVDRAGGPGIILRDLDNDGDLDLVQGYHADVTGARWDSPLSPGEADQGIYVWRNMLAESGEFRFERVTDNGLADYEKLKYNSDIGEYEAVVEGAGLPYITAADVDNDGLLDVIAVGPTDPEWMAHATMTAGRFWKNMGNFRFREVTNDVGLDALNWSYARWVDFFGISAPTLGSTTAQVALDRSVQKQRTLRIGPLGHQFYAADTTFGDFDNDGWIDFVYVNRHEVDGTWGAWRNVLFVNNGDGTFRPVPTEFSGLDSNSISAETADLNGDGLLDLVFVASPSNSYRGKVPLPVDRLQDKVYWNTGLHGARENHWLQVRFSGTPHSRLVGARVYALKSGYTTAAKSGILGMRTVFSNHSYKSGGALDAHFGLGHDAQVNVLVELLDGDSFLFENVAASRFIELNLDTQTITVLREIEKQIGDG